MTGLDLQNLVAWIDGLTAPGVLVVGQPIFDVRHGFSGNFVDWGSPDYAQYRELVQALARPATRSSR